GYPKEGYPLWMDQVMLLKDATNVEEAYKFIDFIMVPENAALISAFARYANGISGSDAFMPEDMKTAPEIVVPEEFRAAGKFLPTCSPKAQEYYTAIWTELQKGGSGRSGARTAGGHCPPAPPARPRNNEAPTDGRDQCSGLRACAGLAGRPPERAHGNGGLPRPDRGGQPGRQRHRHAAAPRGASGRGGGGGPGWARRAALGPARRGQGPGGNEGDADALRLAPPCQPCAGGRRPRGGADARRGGDPDRQDQHAGMGPWIAYVQPGLRGHAEPLRPDPKRGRILGRRGGGAGGADGAARRRIGHDEIGRAHV